MNYDFLFNLYRADLAWLDLDRRLREIPPQMESLDEDIQGRDAGATAKHAQLEELERSIRRLEQELKQKSDKLRGLRVREGAVQSVKALEAGESEIAQIGKSIAAAEDRLLEKIESKEILERELSLRAPEDLRSLTGLQAEIAGLAESQQVFQAKRDEIETERERLLAALDEPTRRRYLRLFRNFNHGSLAAVSNGACSGCGEKLPPQEALDIKKKLELHNCQGCGRLVIWVDA